MPVQTFAINKLPGQDGFIDELNSIVTELAGIADKVIRVDFHTHKSGPAGVSVKIVHDLGVIPDFIWATQDGASDTPFIAVTDSDKAEWNARTVSFTTALANNTYDICLFALT